MVPVFLAMVAAFWLGTVAAQPTTASWVFLRDSAGDVWLVLDNVRYGAPIAPATDEQINSLPFSGKWIAPSADVAAPQFVTTKPAWGGIPAASDVQASAPTATPRPTAAPAPRTVTQAQANHCQSVSLDIALELAPYTTSERAIAAMDQMEGICRDAALRKGNAGVNCFESTFRRGAREQRSGEATFALFDLCMKGLP